MDILLIIITVGIILGIAFILSRPFANPKPTSVPVQETSDYQHQYEALLREIQALQADCEHLDAPDEACSQIEEKKLQAADLLRLMNAPLDETLNLYPAQAPRNAEDTRPENLFLRENTAVCPQCGRRVASSDKFCTHCGNRLQP